MSHTKRIRYIRYGVETIFAIIALGMVVMLVQRHAPGLLKMARNGNLGDLEDYLSAHGKKGGYLIVFLQIAETISIVLPAVPVYICAGVFFGKIKGLAICYLVNLGLNIGIFLVARRLKLSLEKHLGVRKDRPVHRLLQNGRHPDRAVIAMCLLPIVPNGMIPYVCAQTGITLGDFTKALAIGSLPAIAVYVCFGDVLTGIDYRLMLPVLGVLLVAGGSIFLFRQKIVEKFEPIVRAYINPPNESCQ